MQEVSTTVDETKVQNLVRLWDKSLVLPQVMTRVQHQVSSGDKSSVQGQVLRQELNITLQ